MRHGADWYKRNPSAYLGGVQGLTTKEHAVYSVVIDLIYVHGGSVNNDPSWISGWIKDMGTAACRNTINSLVERGKLIIDGDQITQKIARNTAKTKENLSEIRQEAGRLGGINSGKTRRGFSENNDLDEATASSKKQPEKRREDKNPLNPPEGETASLFDDGNRPPDKPDKEAEIDSGFAEFWDQIWPSHKRKAGRKDARRIYGNAILGKHPKADKVSIEDLNRATRAYIASVKDREYLKAPIPWLNLPGWEPFLQSGSAAGKYDDPVMRRAARRAGGG